VRVAAVLLLALAVLAAGCGESGPSEEEAVRATVERYARAVAAKDYDTLCDELFAPELLRGARAQDLPCETALETGLGDVERPTAQVGQVVVDDEADSATARVRTDAANQPPSEDTVRLVRRDGTWRIIALASD
jgi:hypothetical protein